MTTPTPTCFPVLFSLNSKAKALCTPYHLFRGLCTSIFLLGHGEVNHPCFVTKLFQSDWNYLVPRLIISPGNVTLFFVCVSMLTSPLLLISLLIRLQPGLSWPEKYSLKMTFVLISFMMLIFFPMWYSIYNKICHN